MAFPWAALIGDAAFGLGLLSTLVLVAIRTLPTAFCVSDATIRLLDALVVQALLAFALAVRVGGAALGLGLGIALVVAAF